MSLRYPRTTLAHFMSRPVAQHRDASLVENKIMAARGKVYSASHSPNANPDVEAVTFYCLNHVMAAMRQAYSMHEPLPPEAVKLCEDYDQIVSEQATRAFWYLLAITTREARHSHSSKSKVDQIAAVSNAAIASFIASGASEGQIWNNYMAKPPAGGLALYTRAIQFVFYKTSFSGGYGGPKWGNVTDCLHRFVTGEYTAEMMLDTNWTLAHNGGPIFNKGLFYSHWSQVLYRILDVQRAGMIPTAVIHDKQIAEKASPKCKEILQRATQVLDGLVLPGVDWQLVKKLGAKGSYEAEIAQQLGKGIPTAVGGLHQPGKIAKKYGASYKKEPDFDPNEFYQIMPGAMVKKIKRAA